MMTHERLKTIREQQGLSQKYMAKIISTDPSNYSRKERGEVKIHDDEWIKMSEALNIPVEDLKDEKILGIHNENFTFHDHSGNNVNYYNVPDVIMNNTQEYISLLKEQNVLLKEEVRTLKEEIKTLKS